MLQNQRSNGSWGDVDITAAAFQALSQVATTNDVKDALGKAKAFLESKQDASGSFGNIYSTSWAMQALSVPGKSLDYLQSQQALDGGVQKNDTIDNRIWATSYAVPAVLGKDWGSFLTYFSKPIVASKSVEELKIKEPKKENVVVNEDTEIQVLQKQVQEISGKIAIAQQQLAEAQTLKTIAKKVENIAMEIQKVKTEIAALKTSQAPQVFAQIETPKINSVEQPVALAPILAGVEEAPYSSTASVAHAARTGNRSMIFFILLAGAGIFLLLGGWNLVAPFVRGRMSA